jgi:hypothetical protein
MLTTAYLLAWLRAFAFTQVIEAPIYRRIVPCSFGQAFAASLFTHPLVWFIFPLLGRHRIDLPWCSVPLPGLSYVNWTILAELAAWLLEALWFLRFVSWQRALMVSLIGNSASLAIGLACRALTGYP